MPSFDASDMDSGFVQCAVCEKAITGGKWFARIKSGDWMVALCCPLCTEAFEQNPHAYVRRIETLAMMQSVGGIFEDATPQLPQPK
jgi:hypothetical protein